MGDGPGEFSQPWGIAVDTNAYEADWRNDRVQKFTSDGQHLATIGETVMPFVNTFALPGRKVFD